MKTTKQAQIKKAVNIRDNNNLDKIIRKVLKLQKQVKETSAKAMEELERRKKPGFVDFDLNKNNPNEFQKKIAAYRKNGYGIPTIWKFIPTAELRGILSEANKTSKEVDRLLKSLTTKNLTD